MNIDMNHKYQTRDGRAVRILATDYKNGYGGESVLAVVMLEDGTEKILLTDLVGSSNEAAAFDLIPVPTKHEGWILVNALGQWFGGDIFTAERWAQEESAKWGSGVHSAHVTWED